MRECGILMPVASLPGGQGIGSLGQPAHRFIDFLAEAGQQLWQILPVGPTGFGDSPYQSCSAFAGNPYLIDLDLLAEEGLLKAADYQSLKWGQPGQVDYAGLYNQRFVVLRKAYARFLQRRPLPGCDTPYPDDWYTFTFANDGWLPVYCQYMTAKQQNEMKHWREWPQLLRTRQPEALRQLEQENAEEMGFWAFVQYQFYRQWNALKKYAHTNGISILGDVPLYVSDDSADAWAGGELFELTENGDPRRVAGCPPDYFSADGQLWGNPLYNWPYHRATGYAWWCARIGHALRLYDRIRIDHFRGFDTYWAVPAGEKTARNGRWEKGPGMELFHALRDKLGELPIIAEDLGDLCQSVRDLLAESGFPGMKVLQFAFSGPDNEYLPHNCLPHSVCYPGTHDNTTVQDWLDNAATPKEKQFAIDYLALTKTEGYRLGILRSVLATPSELAVIPLADWLGLGAQARINTPGMVGQNWSWRAKEGCCTPALAGQIRTLCARYGRTKPVLKAQEDSAPESTPGAQQSPAQPENPKNRE